MTAQEFIINKIRELQFHVEDDLWAINKDEVIDIAFQFAKLKCEETFKNAKMEFHNIVEEYGPIDTINDFYLSMPDETLQAIELDIKNLALEDCIPKFD